MNTTFDLCDAMTETTGTHFYFHPVILLKNDPQKKGCENDAAYSFLSL